MRVGVRGDQDLDIGVVTKFLEELPTVVARGDEDHKESRRVSSWRARLVRRNCSAWMVWWKGRSGNSTLTPTKIRPEAPRPTAATGKLEMGGRARVWAGETREGRSLAMGEEWAWASDADITNLGLGCSMGFFLEC